MMRMARTIGGSLVFVLMLGCTRAQKARHGEDDASDLPSTDAQASNAPAPPPAEDPSPHVPTPAASPQVRWFGALQAIMHEGRTEAAVALPDVLPGPHAWGVGALEGLTGEITILDDIVWLARPNADATASISRASVDDLGQAYGAALLVVANVERWDELPVATDVASSGLDSFLASQLVAHGDGLELPVPLRIRGPVTALRWHVIDGARMQPGSHHAEHARSAVSGRVESVQGELVGFFSRSHQGVFTHAGSHSHFHVVTADGKLSGHVDGVDLVAGAQLLLPHR